ncbi:MAG: hypothetical protein ABIJ12_08785 [bacterium]
MKNNKFHIYALHLFLFFLLFVNPQSTARMKADFENDRSLFSNFSAGSSVQCLAAHRIGRIELAVANNGTFGIYYNQGEAVDWFTGELINHSCQYPKGSEVSYLYGGAFWISAIVGRDTLVSVGADGWQQAYEMFSDQAPFGEMKFRSISDPDKPAYIDAVSEEDYISVYTDTFQNGIEPDFFGRQHIPLNIEITQSSYAWSYSYAEDFVLFDYKIKNIGQSSLNEVYMGIYVDCMICFNCLNDNAGFIDDHTGFLHTYPGNYGGCEYIDTVNMAWIADDDGDYERIHTDGQKHPCPHVAAARIVRTPSTSLDVSYNWWIGNGNPNLDFGPRERSGVGRRKENFRNFGTGGLGTPEGDANKYYVMSNQEFDYNQIYTNTIQPNDTLWSYPNQDLAAEFSDGYDTRFLLSFGPFNVDPGQTLPVSFAYLIGEYLHKNNDNVKNLLVNQGLYYSNLDFSDLAKNAKWASWIYDNPGVDTDGDGYFGEAHICCTDTTIVSIDTISYDPVEIDTTWELGKCDSFFYIGDGVPDFRGASPPPPPEFWLTPNENSIHIRFNGTRTETTEDVFLHINDFEGYRIYVSRDQREESYSVVASYDREDYNKYLYDDYLHQWGLEGIPMTLDELRSFFNDPDLEPLSYTRTKTYTDPNHQDRLYYFEKQDYNVSGFGNEGSISKIFPEQEYPSSINPDSARTDELTDDGYLKYFEYEFTVTNLLPTVPYYINVTAFDFGSPESGLKSLESSRTVGAKYVYSQFETNSRFTNDKVVVYPNPYRLDAGYRDRGFEGRADTDRPDDRVREIHFANLPAKCTIRICTLDGDLVKEINHDMDPSNPNSTHDSWNLITRNTQLVVSGLYYWSVEEPNGAVQIGNLAIIM